MSDVLADQPLSEEELDELSNIFERAGSLALNLEAVDGLFSALICGPELVLPSEYLPHIWGEEAMFENRDDIVQAMNLLMRHWNTIAGTLHGTLHKPDVYMPILFEDGDGVTRGNNWAQGFMRGALIRPLFWHELMTSEEHGGMLIPIMLLSHEIDPDPTMRPPPIPLEKREDILLEMIASLTNVYRHFEPQRRSMLSGTQMSPSSRPRTRNKIGRNEACPCGSGKKYKRCCALTVH